jgi:hypothetical protein
MAGLSSEMRRINARHGIIGYKLYNGSRRDLPQGATETQRRDRAAPPSDVDANHLLSRNVVRFRPALVIAVPR